MPDLSITGDGRLPGVHASRDERLKGAAAQFETAFIQLLFQGLDGQQLDDEPLMGGGADADQFKQLYHSGLSERAAGHLGVADMLVNELSVRAGVHSKADHQEPRP